MDAVTYPDEKVIEFIENNLIPLRIPFDSQPLANQFNLKWTPTLIIIDSEGKEHERIVGFLPPEEIIPFLLLGIAKSYFDHGEFNKALELIEKIITQFPASSVVPETIFLKGVCGYKSSHNQKHLKEAYEQLQAKYPSSEWAKKAFPYRLL